eukprot:c8653_g1_i1.p1 GENE.c8653_g1_i1~~c8653_g1_i1.p1  ORF type:complete len:443 (-),score=94.17 c8653_g1_i1:408-1700(-)
MVEHAELRRLDMEQHHPGGITPGVRKQLIAMKTYPPLFTRFITFVQVVVMICSMVPQLGGTQARWGVSAQKKYFNVTTFESTAIQEVKIPDNMWFGPDVTTMLQWGVKYTPCMREDATIANRIAAAKLDEKNFGCCVQRNLECGMMNVSRCDNPSWHFHANVTCKELPACSIVIRPCCYGIQGDCAELTPDHCSAVQGHYHSEKQMCREVNCLEDMCGMGGFAQNIPDQWWRLITPIFMHIGVIHLLFNVVFQLKVCGEIESFAGPFRTALVYLMAGVSGVIFGSVFTPTSISAGSSGALYGMLGVVAVDLFQSWQLIPKHERLKQVASLVGLISVMLGVGTLPWIDNWAHVGGFIVGVAGGIAFMPYIHFGKWDERRKLLMKVVAMAVLAVGSLSGLVVFYIAPNPDFCKWCQYVNCVPYKKGMCDSLN